MWFEHSVPAPVRLPDVSMRLGDCVRAFRSGTTRIDVHVRAGKGWQKINALRFEVGDDEVDPGTIAGWVKACAEHHAALANAPGTYRAMVWRYVGGELERRKAAFSVTLPRPARPPRPQRPRPRARSPRDFRRTMFETKLMLEEIMAEDATPHFESYGAPRPPGQTALDRVLRELAVMAERFDGALTTGTADDIHRADFQIRWEVATLRAQEDGDLWTAIAPTIDARLDELRREALAKRKATDTAPTEAHMSEPAAESMESAPQPSGDAASPGADGSSTPALGWFGSEPPSLGGSELS